MRLTDRHRKAAVLIVAGFTKRDVAEKVGVVPTTISGWMNEESFQRELKFIRNYTLGIVQESLKGLVMLGLENMKQLLGDDDKAVKFRATELLFRSIGGLRMIPFEELREPEREDPIDKITRLLSENRELLGMEPLHEKLPAPRKTTRRPRQLDHYDEEEES